MRSSRTFTLLRVARILYSAPAASLVAAWIILMTGSAWAQMRVDQGTSFPVRQGKAQLVGHYPGGNMLRLVIGLKTPHPDEEEKFLKELQTKGSPGFHQYLTADEWNKRFGPSAEDEQAVVDWARSQGLTVTKRYGNHLIVDLEAPAATVEKAFGVTLNQYTYKGESFFSNDQDPQLPSNLSGIVLSVLGLNTWDKGKPHNRRLPQAAQADYSPGPVDALGGSGHGNGNPAKRPTPATKSSASGIANFMGGSMEPGDMFSQGAYDTNALYAQGHCCNPTGLSSAGPVTSVAIATAGTFYNGGSDFSTFFPQYGMAWDLNWYFIDGTPGCCDGEGTMDTEWVGAMANSFGGLQNTAHEYIYQGVNSNFSTFTDIFNTMLTNGYARTMTTSWGWIDATIGSSNMNTWHNIFNSMVGQGWTLVAASGDGGASYSCQNFDSVSYPASDPDVVAAGGTTLRQDTSRDFLSEVAWSGGPDGCSTNDGGSTGGCSVYWGTPGYQGSYCSGHRAVPDISLNADWYNTPQVLYFQGGWQGNGGTSIVAPEVAGFVAQVNAYQLALPGAYSGTGLGNVNYAIYNTAYNGAPHNPFYDTTSGCNNNNNTSNWGLGYYCAGAGYDLVTGWGSFNMLQLAWAINWQDTSDIGYPSISFSGPATNYWYNFDVYVAWTVADTGGGGTISGVSGFSQAWDSDPGNGDPGSEPHGNPFTYLGTFGYPSNSFYSGPEYPNATSGYEYVSWIGQGCHTAGVRAWDNMGLGAYNTYGPVCYDTIAPVTKSTLSGTKSGSIYVTPVQDSLTASDFSPGSGVASTVYQINGGTLTGYSSPFTISANGAYSVTFHSTDVAGNLESTKTTNFTIARWLPETSGTTNNLRAISCVSATNCEIVGFAGIIRGTTNGGTTWGTQKSGTANNLNGVSCLSTFCVAVGNSGTVLVTTNSGGIWTAKSSGTTQNLLGVSCVSTTFCVAVGASGKIIETINGGSTWASKTSGTTNSLNAVSCISTSVCKAVGAAGTIRATTNGGSNWTGQASGTTNALNGVYCRTGSSFCVAVGVTGTIITTGNGGTNWSTKPSGTTQNLNAVSCSSTTICRAVGDAGTVRSTTNGGGAWSTQPTGSIYHLFGVSTQSVTLAYADGNAGTILKQ